MKAGPGDLVIVVSDCKLVERLHVATMPRSVRSPPLRGAARGLAVQSLLRVPDTSRCHSGVKNHRECTIAL